MRNQIYIFLPRVAAWSVMGCNLASTLASPCDQVSSWGDNIADVSHHMCLGSAVTGQHQDGSNLSLELEGWRSDVSNNTPPPSTPALMLHCYRVTVIMQLTRPACALPVPHSLQPLRCRQHMSLVTLCYLDNSPSTTTPFLYIGVIITAYWVNSNCNSAQGSVTTLSERTVTESV